MGTASRDWPTTCSWSSINTVYGLYRYFWLVSVKKHTSNIPAKLNTSGCLHLLFVLELCLFFRKALVFVLGFSCFGKNFSPKAIGYYVTSFPLFLETPGKMDTSFGCSDFWHLLVGQELVMIGWWCSKQPLLIQSLSFKACLPKQSQKSLRRKHVTIPVMVSGMGNWACGS